MFGLYLRGIALPKHRSTLGQGAWCQVEMCPCRAHLGPPISSSGLLKTMATKLLQNVRYALSLPPTRNFLALHPSSCAIFPRTCINWIPRYTRYATFTHSKTSLSCRCYQSLPSVYSQLLAPFVWPDRAPKLRKMTMENVTLVLGPWA